MSFIAAAIIGAGGAIFSGYEANKAASAQSNALSQAGSDILQGQSQAISAIQSLVGPYAKFGQELQPTLSSLLTPGPNQTEAFNSLPGAKFVQQLVGEEIAAGAGRTGISGSTAVAGGTLGAALAGSQFSTLINPLLSLYGTGANAASGAASGLANIATGTAGSLGQLAIGKGNVQAGLAGAYGNIGNNLAGTLSNAALFSKLTGGGGLNSNPFSTPITNPNMTWT